MLRVLLSLAVASVGVIPARAADRAPGAVIVYLSTARTLLVWYATRPDHLQLDSVQVGRDSLATLVTRLREALAPVEDLTTCRSVPRSGDVAAAEQALAAVLLPPNLRRVVEPGAEVVVVPQGALQLVPFAALPADSLGTPFGIRNALRYAPSLASLVEAERRRRRVPDPAKPWANALIVGNPDMPRIRACGITARPAALPAVGAMSRRLAAQLGARYLTGPEATEAAVRSLMRDAPLVHLATHGYAYTRDEQARESWVALAPAAGDDGLLTVAEILARDTLSAELVVLAACETGVGDAKSAEGVIGLQRALLAKGARSVLVSLWTVNEAATVRLLDAFYAQWLDAPDRPSKSEALRRAQEAVRTDPAHPEWKAPEYWASFVLVGAA